MPGIIDKRGSYFDDFDPDKPLFVELLTAELNNLLPESAVPLFDEDILIAMGRAWVKYAAGVKTINHKALSDTIDELRAAPDSPSSIQYLIRELLEVLKHKDV
jgi:hypothetical protein